MSELCLGRFELCLNVRDLAASLTFYEELGFRRIGGTPEERFVILRQRDCVLGLFQGHFKEAMLLNFRGGDVFDIARAIKAGGIAMKMDAKAGKDGGASALVQDPDGNTIFFDTAPGETPDGLATAGTKEVAK